MIVVREDDTGASVMGGTRQPKGINASCGGPSLVIELGFCWFKVFDRFIILRAGILGGRYRSTDEVGVDIGQEPSTTNGRGG